MAEQPVPPPSLGLSPLSRVRLDEQLQEMLDRVGEVMASRERLRSLLDAVVGIGSDLDLRSTLQRIVEAACALAGARSGPGRPVGGRRRPIDLLRGGEALSALLLLATADGLATAPLSDAVEVAWPRRWPSRAGTATGRRSCPHPCRRTSGPG